MACACVVLLLVVAHHYDRRDNERGYRALAKVATWLGFPLFAVAFIWRDGQGIVLTEPR